MDNNAPTIVYSQEFKDFLEIAKKCNQTYVGNGNPNAPILIVANEPGVVNESIIKNDLEKNRERWEINSIKQQDLDSLENVFNHDKKVDWNKFNPLWPYKGQYCTQIRVKKEADCIIKVLNENKFPTSRSWIQYQKFVNLVYGKSEEVKGQPLDFFRHAFITDFSAVYGKHSNEISYKERLDSITQRLPLFASEFISHFPIIVVASGHYIHDFKPLNDLRKVFKGFNKDVETVIDECGWRHIHYSDDKKRVLIHAYHLASAIKNEYLKRIADVCKNDNRIYPLKV